MRAVNFKHLHQKSYEKKNTRTYKLYFAGHSDLAWDILSLLRVCTLERETGWV